MLAQGSTIQSTESANRGRELQRAWLWLRARLAAAFTISPELRHVLGRSLQTSAAAYTLWRVLRTLRPTLPTTHPGTAAWRKLCDNPVIQPYEFESRFIGRAPELLTQGPWDFIIVGSGSAGCVLASRLAAHEGVRVLLVEAGGEAQNAGAVVTPNRAMDLYRSEVDWGFRSAPQPHLLPKGRTVNLERGLSLGGSSTTNWLMWVRGQRQDFDRWATQMGCGEDWSYERVVPHFTQLERLTRLTAPSSDRGKEGPIGVSTLNAAPREVKAFLEACSAAGLNVGSDYNSFSQDGAGPVQFSMVNGRRCDAFTSFVEPLLESRPNLQVISEVFVRRVLFDDGLRARSVEVELNDGSVLPLRASREVVLAAGAIGSPHVLMHSGLGDQQELKALGIPVLAHVPAVGKNLQDHVTVVVPCELKEAYDTIHQGSSGTSAVAFAHSPTDRAIAEAEGHERGPDCELIFMSRLPPQAAKKLATEGMNTVFTQATGVDASQRPMLWRALAGTGVALGRTSQVQQTLRTKFFLAGMLNHPEGRGSMRLHSKDPHVAPIIDPNYCSDRRDVEKMKWFALQLRDLLRHPSLQQLVTTVAFPELSRFRPVGSVLDDTVTDEQLEAFVRSVAGTTWHYSCTVRMGDASDESCACDPRLRVKGVTGLRCADASIMPFVPAANTNAVSMVIGSMAAKFIAEDHGLTGTAAQGLGPQSRL